MNEALPNWIAPWTSSRTGPSDGYHRDSQWTKDPTNTPAIAGRVLEMFGTSFTISAYTSGNCCPASPLKLPRVTLLSLLFWDLLVRISRPSAIPEVTWVCAGIIQGICLRYMPCYVSLTLPTHSSRDVSFLKTLDP